VDDWGLAAAIARIRGPAGSTAGVGFLVTTDVLATCAHVVNAALDREWSSAPSPVGPVIVDFPLLGRDGAGMAADVVGWVPARPDGSGDTALLRLRVVPPGAHRVRLALADARWGEPVRLYGFPVDLPEGYGVWLAAEVRARQGAGWLQVESVPGGRRIGPGFSGAPVWSPRAGGVVGMVVAADRAVSSTTGYLVPAAALVEAHEVLSLPDPAEVCPYRGLDPFLAEHARFFRGRERLVDRLVELTGRQPLVVVAGPSGSGKSSLVHAGLAPRLREQRVLVADVRPQPGLAPEALLATVVLRVMEPDAAEVDRAVRVEQLAGWLAAGRPGSVALLAAAVARSVRPGGLLVVVDQFEELAAAPARALFELLADLVHAVPAVADGWRPLRVLLTARSATLDLLVGSGSDEVLPAGLLLLPPMRRAELLAVVTAADLTFEEGLTERLVTDAGNEPGRLPLVEFALTQLWARRSAGRLTHGAYAEIGGVSGAIARFAERTYQEGLTGAERQVARRLLVQMAAPDAEGGFVRRSVRLTDLAEDARAVLVRLAASRLVVVGRTVAEEEFADLAHQALLQEWPALRGWLAENREFRAWQEQLRQDRDRWQSAGQDRDALLRGFALATATHWLEQRPADLTPREGNYVAASLANAQRRRRLVRSVVAMIAVLAVVATSLALIAGLQTATAQARLRTAASRALADEANRFRTIDPQLALQVAQGAWHADHTPEAYGALLTQYAALQPVNRVFENLWEGEVGDLQASRDGSVAVVTNEGGLPFVWLGLNGDHPRHWKLPTGGRRYPGGTFALSSDGRKLAYANDDQDLVVWNVADNGKPTVLHAPSTRPGPEPLTAESIAFSPDNTRLLVRRARYTGDDPELELWDVASQQRLPVSNHLAPDLEASSTASFGPTAGTVVLSDGFQVWVDDLRTGRSLRHMQPAKHTQLAIGRAGAVLAECSYDIQDFTRIDPAQPSTVRIVNSQTGAEQQVSQSSDSCESGFLIDGTTDYGLALSMSAQVDKDSTASFTAVDLHTGRSYGFSVPPVDLTTFGRGSLIALYPGSDGIPVALLADHSVLYRIAGTSPVAGPDSGDLRGRVIGAGVSPDGRYRASLQDSGLLVLTDIRTGTPVASAQTAWRAPPPINQGNFFAFGPDSRSLLVVEGDTLVVHALPDLGVRQRLPLPQPLDIGPPPEADRLHAWASSILPLAVDDTVVLYAGRLTRWNPVTGAQTGTPITLRADPAGERRSALLAILVPLRRPGHPDDVAVVEPSGEVEIWDLGRRAPVTTVATDASAARGPAVFDTTGTRLAVATKTGQVVVWNVDENRADGSPIPTGQVDAVLGFTPTGQLITLESDSASLWDQRSGKLLAALRWPEARQWRLAGTRLTGFGAIRTWTVDLDPETWFRRLCQLSNRPYSDRETPLLRRNNAPTDPPCS
jgi:WD40 repeat protein